MLTQVKCVVTSPGKSKDIQASSSFETKKVQEKMQGQLQIKDMNMSTLNDQLPMRDVSCISS